MRDSASQVRERRDRGGGSGSPLGTLREFTVHAEIIDDFSSAYPFETRRKFHFEDLSTPEAKRKFRWRLAWAQREAIFKAGLAKEFSYLLSCHSKPVPRFSKNKKTGVYSATGSPGCVEAHYYGKSDESPVGYAWLIKDGNPLLCFVCAPKVRYYRSLEVITACKHMVNSGYSALFWTFTAPHDLATDPKFQVKQFNKAKGIFKSGDSINGLKWEDIQEKWCFEHQITAVEMTDDAPWSARKTGCHWHAHAVPLFKRSAFSDEELREMYAELSERWVNCLIKVGLCTEEKRADALRYAFRLDAPRSHDEVRDIAAYIAKAVSCEITPGIFTKDGRLPGRLSHWQVMSLAFSGQYPELVPRSLAIMKALKGRHWLHWTKGLKELCGIKEVSDEEIMKEKKSLPVYQFKGGSWWKVDRQKWQINLLNAAIRDLKKKGFDFSLAPQDLSEEQIKTVHDVFEDNMKKVSYGVDPEKVEFYSCKIMLRDSVSVREYLADLIAQNFRQYGRKFVPLRC